MSIIAWPLIILSALLSIPVVVLLFEVLAAVLLRPKTGSSSIGARPLVAVLIPAHNESADLLPTVQDVQAQLGSRDRLVVIADNCTDDTASVARNAGSEVIERNDPRRIGKGFALDCGLRHLALDPPQVVIVIDADCRVDANTIDILARGSAATSRPVQSLDLMIQANNSDVDHRIAEFAWRVKNWVRPLGLHCLNLPCQLMGTGMAFPWRVICSADLASGEVVEDLRLGLELAAVGNSALFCPAARVTSVFPSSPAAAKSQRERWEGGQLKLIWKTTPRLLLTAIKERNVELLVLTLDLLVPPITVLALLLIASLGCSFAVMLFFSLTGPLIISGANLIALTLALFIAWHVYGRDILNGGLSVIPNFVFGKVSLYIRMVLRRGSALWVRTERDRSRPAGD